MVSKAPDVDTYLAEVPPERRGALEKLRVLCHQQLKGYEEEMAFGMPAYKRNGKLEIAFGSQKQYIALYVMKKDVIDEFRSRLPGLNIGKGCIRFPKPESIDFAVVKDLLKRNAASKSAAC